ncbi:MAG: glycerol dehydratase reactivase beta/small subunit family protein [Chloroflexota bacterium]|nr:MAG: hypothetical protein KatS3mg045_1343 [Bellilinea sp.]
MMATSTLERPAIYVALMPGVPQQYAHRVEIGAEEEGVPCRLVEMEGKDVLDLAYQCAIASPLKIGVAVSENAVVLHEIHMPPQQPVLSFDLNNHPQSACRVMGANAARLFVRRPLYLTNSPEFAQPAPPPTVENSQDLSSTELNEMIRIVFLVLQKLRERGAL